MSGEKLNSERMMYERQKELRKSLETTKRISIEDLASQITAIGFECLRCGDCCVGDDNSVVVFPFEIRKILAATGVGWLDAVEPPTIGEWDCHGNFHTLEWRIKKEEGSCKFHSEKGCEIYQTRPMMCKTYPFYLDEEELLCSECRGLGREIGSGEAEKIAARIIERRITELEEAIALLEKYQDFERGQRSEKGACIVHDSEGSHAVEWRELPPDFGRL
jgi:uncharacterized protein